MSAIFDVAYTDWNSNSVTFSLAILAESNSRESSQRTEGFAQGEHAERQRAGTSKDLLTAVNGNERQESKR